MDISDQISQIKAKKEKLIKQAYEADIKMLRLKIKGEKAKQAKAKKIKEELENLKDISTLVDVFSERSYKLTQPFLNYVNDLSLDSYRYLDDFEVQRFNDKSPKILEQLNSLLEEIERASQTISELNQWIYHIKNRVETVAYDVEQIELKT
ncbi:hypothetical protein [Haemophilus sp. Marseille-Q0026]|uniref:hypothetical protein n=1 Tax=Haemophilus sp. Marseille-Q0026 TaxID=2866580 RepID=UPI001CF8AD0D|nr:hypothetical protein [Haemophilus sp. Marseille-Q0026]